jgi:uncharacterized protein YndB with AHSA1/START domain
MSTNVQRGYLLLADISGYTSYLAGVELDHAHEILTDLLETILDCLKPLLTVAKLEGDAVFAYASDQRIPHGETVLELVEATYSAFRDRKQAIQQRTTCTCNACRNIPALDLKFIVHHGEYLLQKVQAIVEPIGSDVNLAHRLMKNGIRESTGWQAYALYTQRALAQMQVALPQAHHQTESYDHLGSVLVECVDLQERYGELTRMRRIYLTTGDADRVMEYDFAAAPPVVWDWFTDPEKRSLWMRAEILPILRVDGRQAAGARNHCVHGKNETVVEDFLDIRPFDYYTVEHRPQGSPLALRMTFQFAGSAGGGTHLTLTLKSLGRGLPSWAGRPITQFITERTLKRRWAFDQIDSLIEKSLSGSG